MPKIWDTIKYMPALAPFSPSAKRDYKKFFAGSPEIRENVSNLRPEQEGLYNQLLQSGQGPGAGGAFGQAADYYRGLMDENSAEYKAQEDPILRQYSQDIAPQIKENFAGMGAGGLDSSGAQNAQALGGIELTERLAALRANLRNQGAQGLANIGSMGLGNFSTNMATQQGTQGALPALGGALGAIGGAYAGGPIGANIGANIGTNAASGIGEQLGRWIKPKTSGNSVGAKTSAYGLNGPKASPSPGWGNMQPPNFLQGQARGF